jgi:hypothetical protein
MNKRVILAGIGLALISLYSLKSCLVKNREIGGRPWAYGDDKKALLVGVWSGSFQDPGGVAKQIKLEIDPPLTAEEIDKKINHRRRNSRVRSSDLRSFDGVATVTSTLGTESYVIHGSVGASNHHEFSLSLGPEDESKRVLPNFTARAMDKGLWSSDTLEASLSFTHHGADGASHSSSEGEVVNGQVVWKEDPADKPVKVTLKRE